MTTQGKPNKAIKSRSLYVGLFALLVVVGIIIASLLFQRSTTSSFVLGGLFALTGDAADWGRDEKRGVELALREWKSKHPNIKINFAVEDAPATDVAASVNAFRNLVNLRGAKVIIGPTWDDVAAALAPLTEQEKILMIAPDASSGIEKIKDFTFFFSIFTPEAIEMKRLLTYLSQQKISRVATVYNQDPFSQQWRDAFVSAALGFGMKVVQEIPIADPETQDFRTQLSRLKALNVDAIYVEFTSQDTKGPFMRQALEIGLKTRIVSSSTSETESLLKNYRDYLNGLTYAYPKTTKAMTEFVSAFEHEYGSKPSSPAAPYAYDAARIVLNLFEQGNRDAESMQRTLLSLRDFNGVTSDGLSFDKKGRVVWPAESFVIKTIRSGQPEILEP